MLPHGKSNHNFNQDYAVEEETASNASCCSQLCIENENCAGMTYREVADKPYGLLDLQWYLVLRVRCCGTQ